MSVDLLKKIRSLNRLLQRSGANPLIFGDICILCRDLLNSNVMVVTKKGKILDVYNHDEQEGAFLGSLGERRNAVAGLHGCAKSHLGDAGGCKS